MDVFDLQAKITLDSSGFESALSRSKEGLEGIVTKANLFAQAIHDIGIKAADVFGKVSESIVKVGSGFDTAMANVAAISGATGDDLDALREKAKEMGATTKFSASEAADAFGYMAMAGWKTEDMLAGIDGIMNLAAASGEGLATTSDIVTDALTAFGLSAEDAGHFADVLAAASSNANTNVSMMGETFKYIAPLAGTLGYSAEDVAVAVGLMANSGIKAGQAGTSLRAALSSLLEPTEKTKDLMRDLGLIVTDTVQVLDNDKIATQQGKVASSTANLNKKQIAYNNAVAKYGAESSNAQKAMIDLEEAQRKAGVENDKLSKLMGGSTQVIDLYNAAVTDASGNSLSLSQTLDVLRDTFENLTHTEQASAAAQLFGREAMSGMMAIINAAPADITKLESAVGDASGAAKSMAAIMQDNVGGAWDEFTSAVEGAQIAIYETFSDDLQDHILFAADGVSRLTAAFEEGGASGAMNEVVTMLSEITGLDLSGVTEGFAGIGEAFSGIGEAFSEIKTAFAEGGIGGGFEAITAQIETLTGLDLSGVTEGFAGISDTFADIGAAFESGGVAEGLTTIVETIGKAAGIDVSGVVDGIQGIAEAIGNAAQGFAAGDPVGAINMLVDTFAQATGIDLSGFVDGIWTVVDTIAEFAPQAAEKVQEIFGQIQELFTVYVEYVSAIWPIVQPMISGVFSAIGTLIQTTFDTISSVITGILDAISGGVDVITGVIGAVAAVLKGDFEAAASAIQSAWNGVLDFFGGIANGIMDAFKGLVSGMAGIGKQMWEGLKSGFSAAVDGFKGLGEKLTDGFKDVFGIHSPSRVFAEIGGFMAQGLEQGWNSEISINRFKAPTIRAGRIDVKDSTMGRLSTAAINNAIGLASGSGGNGQPVMINLVMDSRTMAQVLFDPLSGVAKQKGTPIGTW